VIGHLVVELVTPVMIGGAEARKLDDPPTLRPPSLRGHLRFWSRALDGETLEKELWGEEKLGQRVQILSVATIGNRGQKPDLKKPKEATLLDATQQHRATRPEMVPPGDQVILCFGIPDSVPRDRLQAVLWTWLHLGTIGRRSRRGYGSVRWRPSEGDLLAGWPPLWPSHHLKSKESLEEYLKEGLARACSSCGRPGQQDRRETQSLDSLDQVFVGEKELVGRWEAAGGPIPGQESLESIVHGFNEDARGADPDRSQLGSAKPNRLPSPILWRFFPIPGKAAFRPVMTWFPTGYGSEPAKLDPSGKVFKHLSETFGFNKSLAGNSLDA
jgi:hypothetical protein